MKTLILPVAGQSSRYEGMRPKWMLTTPDGKLMIEKSVEKIDLKFFERIILVCLAEHVHRYSEQNKITCILKQNISDKIEILMLNEATVSQVETIAIALDHFDVEGAFFIKDCDNVFGYEYAGGNEVAVVDIHSVSNVDSGNKSYVQTDPLDIITNIIEKRVISNLFCCGGYGFSSVSLFQKHWNNLKDNEGLYLSHVIYSMILEGVQFQAKLAEDYIDLGTLKDYRNYCSKHLVVFCDIDGVLFKNSSKFAPGGWSYQSLKGNIDTLKRLKEIANLYLVVTTSRPSQMQAELEAELEQLGIRPDQCVMGLPHAVRLLINDYSMTNPYPTAVAINIERDTESLDLMLNRYLS